MVKSISLNWNRYKAWGDTIDEYLLYRKIDNGEYELLSDEAIEQFLGSSITSQSDTDLSYVEERCLGFVHCFRLEGKRVPQFEGDTMHNLSLSNEVCIEFENPIDKLYDAISPNGDGLNDVLFIDNIECYDNELFIFNRWGDRVYYKRNYISGEWDGDNLPDGTYFMILEQTKRDGTRREPPFKESLLLHR